MVEFLDYFNELLTDLVNLLFNKLILVEAINLSFGDLLVYSFFAFFLLNFVRRLNVND